METRPIQGLNTKGQLNQGQMKTTRHQGTILTHNHHVRIPIRLHSEAVHQLRRVRIPIQLHSEAVRLPRHVRVKAIRLHGVLLQDHLAVATLLQEVRHQVQAEVHPDHPAVHLQDQETADKSGIL
jgi:hypothetical protein